VDAANWLASQIAALDHAIAAAEHEAETISSRLHASAAAYEQQEWFSAASLGGGGSRRGSPVGMPGVVPRALPMPAAAPVGGGGIEPTSGRQASALIHGGPGPQGLHAAQAALNARAVQLDLAATSVRATRDLVAHSWESTAADAALAQLGTLESRYERLATDARQLAGHGQVLAANFQNTALQMPTQLEFDDTTARLQAAMAANSIPGNQGAARQAINYYNQKLAALEGQGRTAFTGYRTANGAVSTGMAPSAETGMDPRGVPGPAGVGTGAQPGAGTQPGTGKGDLTAAGQANALNDPQQMGGAAMGQILGAVVPAVGAAMSGGLGALMGGGTGATAPLASLGQLASGFAGAATGAGSHSGDSPAGRPGGLGGSPDIGKGLGGGGGGAGGTEPASAPAGPLVAPASATGASAAAAPASVTGVGGASPSAGMGGMGGAAMGGGMMSPMMGGPMGGAGGGGGGSEAERQLYPERRLRIETPANSEPVKGRRETRRSRDDRPSG
jgi:PPE family